MTHLKLALAWEDADPLVVIVGDDDVTIRVDGHARRPLQLTRRPAPDPETTFELAVVGENLCRTNKSNKEKIRKDNWMMKLHQWPLTSSFNICSICLLRAGVLVLPGHTGCCCLRSEPSPERRRWLPAGWWTPLCFSLLYLKAWTRVFNKPLSSGILTFFID